MSLASIVLLALGLAMDATAVAAARGLSVPRVLPRHIVLVAGLFGGSQALMPLLGWLLGAGAGSVIQAWAHWVAFGLLAAIGAKMLWEARAAGAGEASVAREGDPFGLRILLVLAVATSIDALAAGISLPMLGAPLLLSLVTIGLTTAVLSAAGLYAGRRFGAALGRRLEAFGGLVLIGLGIKILLER